MKENRCGDIDSIEEIAEQMDVHGNTKSPQGCKRSRTMRALIPHKLARLFGRAKGRKQKVTLPEMRYDAKD